MGQSVAAEHDSSVSQFLGRLLKDRMIQDQNYQSDMAQYFSRKPVPLKRRSGKYPTREALHDR